MSRYGCHSKPRPTAGAPIEVQDGYIENLFGRDRIDRIVEIPYVMTVPCQYTVRHPADPECAGCPHQSKCDTSPSP